MAQNDLASPIGRPLDRVDGPLKVTGGAKYAFEYAAQGEAAYGFIVSAVIGKGRSLAAAPPVIQKNSLSPGATSPGGWLGLPWSPPLLPLTRPSSSVA